MGKGEKKGKLVSRRVESEGEDERQKQRKTASQDVFVRTESDDDDDKEANEDLSLKIVEKAMLRRLNQASSSKTDTGNFEDEIVMNFADDRSKKKESKKKRTKIVEPVLKSEEEKGENEKTAEVVDEVVKTDPVEVSDNTVLRKLLRGPRYFDPPDSSWGTCYNCGEEGHMAVNCTSARRKKPCFVCGSLEHLGKQCTKGKDCYVCRKGGHQAKDCPENSRKAAKNSKICLKCGDSGHDMFACCNNYFSDDIKEIECYICGSRGHLCCVNYINDDLREMTCYRCGLSGHTGLACSGTDRKTASSGSASVCFRCGEQGHFVRECTNSSEGGKKHSESYTPRRRVFQEYIEVGGSAPQDLGKKRKRKKPKSEREFYSASKPKSKYGWSTEHPGDVRSSKGKATPWGSPATPNKIYRTPDYTAPNHATSYSPWEGRNLHYNSPASNGYQPQYSYGSATHHSKRLPPWQSNGSGELYHQPRFGARFDNNSSSLGTRRNHGW